MKKFSVSHIQTWLVIFLVMVILTTIAVYLIAYVEITRTLASVYNAAPGSETSTVIQQAKQAEFSGLKIRLLLLLSAAILIICALGYLWVGLATRQLKRPLRIISRAISRMARGKLNSTVTIASQEEFTQIATGLNELAANLQELLLYIWKQSGQCLVQLEKLEVDPAHDGDAHLTAAQLDHIHQIYKSVDSLRNMAKAYVFYDVHLEGEHTLSISEPGHAASSENDHYMAEK